MCVFNISRVTWVIGSSVMQPLIMIKDASNRPLLFPGYSHLKTVHDDTYLPPQSCIVSDRPRESQKASSYIMGSIFLMMCEYLYKCRSESASGLKMIHTYGTYSVCSQSITNSCMFIYFYYCLFRKSPIISTQSQ